MLQCRGMIMLPPYTLFASTRCTLLASTPYTLFATTSYTCRQEIAAADWHAVKTSIAKAKQQCDEGGDWERKNRLKVYEALFSMATRDFKRAANLFLDSIATFTTYAAGGACVGVPVWWCLCDGVPQPFCSPTPLYPTPSTELFAYETSIFYTVVTALVALDRVSIKAKVVDAPEILTVIHKVPHLEPLLNSLYGCKYSDFMKVWLFVFSGGGEGVCGQHPLIMVNTRRRHWRSSRSKFVQTCTCALTCDTTCGRFGWWCMHSFSSHTRA